MRTIYKCISSLVKITFIVGLIYGMIFHYYDFFILITRYLDKIDSMSGGVVSFISIILLWVIIPIVLPLISSKFIIKPRWFGAGYTLYRKEDPIQLASTKLIFNDNQIDAILDKHYNTSPIIAIGLPTELCLLETQLMNQNKYYNSLDRLDKYFMRNKIKRNKIKIEALSKIKKSYIII